MGGAPVGITQADRSQPFFVIGKTRSGKTTFMRNLMEQDIVSGRGFSFFDPHGQDARKLIRMIPPGRINDVLFFDPKDHEYPIGFNVLEEKDPKYHDLIVEGVLSFFENYWKDEHANRMVYILRNCLYTLLYNKDSTLLHVRRLLVDEAYRESSIKNVRKPAVLDFWKNEFDAWDYRFRIQAIQSLLNRIGFIVSNDTLTYILGQKKSSLDPRRAMDNSKIIIADLSGVGEKVKDFLGSLLLTFFHIGALRRRSIFTGPLAPHNVYIDEVHEISTRSTARMLSGVGKFGLTLTLAQQYLDQNEDDQVRKALLGNSGHLAVFRVSPKDARELSDALDPEIVGASELTSLGVGELYIRTTQGKTVLTQRATTNQNSLFPYIGKEESVIRSSRHYHGRPCASVTRQLRNVFSSQV